MVYLPSSAGVCSLARLGDDYPKSVRLAPVRRSEKRARSCLRPPRRREIDLVLVCRLDRRG
jgi:hypothetical protein